MENTDWTLIYLKTKNTFISNKFIQCFIPIIGEIRNKKVFNVKIFFQLLKNLYILWANLQFLKICRLLVVISSHCTLRNDLLDCDTWRKAGLHIQRQCGMPRWHGVYISFQTVDLENNSNEKKLKWFCVTNPLQMAHECNFFDLTWLSIDFETPNTSWKRTFQSRAQT